jgi:hypothetical protein
MEAAETKLNGDRDVIEACSAGLDAALTELPAVEGGGMCSTGTYGGFCSALTGYGEQYAAFLQEEMDTLYRNLYDAEQLLAETEEGIAEATMKMAATDRSDPGVQAQINAAVAQYEALLPGSGAGKKVELEARYDQEHQAAVQKRDDWITLKSGQEAAVTNAQATLDAAIDLLIDPAIVTNDTQCGNDGTVDCAGKYQELCNDAYELISEPVTVTDTVTYTTKDEPPTTYTITNTHDFTGQFHADWADYENKKMLYDSANENYEKLAAMLDSGFAMECKAIDKDRKVEVWPVWGAEEVLRRVDKRSVLQ